MEATRTSTPQLTIRIESEEGYNVTPSLSPITEIDEKDEAEREHDLARLELWVMQQNAARIEDQRMKRAELTRQIEQNRSALQQRVKRNRAQTI